MLNLARRLQRDHPCLQQAACQVRFFRNDPGSSSSSPPTRRRSKLTTVTMKKPDDKSYWWVVDGEMHEIGENVPPRERFVIPRDNIPNWRRKKLREQFMRRTRLVLKESEHEPWCRRYMELYNELRENWERLYWDEGYSKKIAQDHANCDSAEDDDEDFSPYRRRQPPADQTTVGPADQMKDQSMVRHRQDDTRDRVNQIRDKFEYDRERRMRQNAFAPMNGRSGFGIDDSGSRNQPFDTRRYFPPTPRDGIDDSGPRNQPFDTRRYFPPTPRDVIDDSGSRNQPFDTRRYSPPTPRDGIDDSGSRNQPFDTRDVYPNPRDGIDDSGSRNQPFDTRRYFPPTPRH